MFREKTKNVLFATGLLVGYLGSALGAAIWADKAIEKTKAKIGRANTEENQRRATYSEISRLIADFDGRPGTSTEDWAIVYNKAFGLPFDAYRENPAKLSLQDLTRIDVDAIRREIGK